MNFLGADVCQRCFTTHPANDAGERICPKPPTPESHFDCPGVIWKTTGGTRGFSGSRRGAKVPYNFNPGHEDLTLGKLGLTEDDGKKLGI